VIILKTTYIITLILLIAIVIIGFTTLLYRYYKDKLELISKKLNNAQDEFNEKLNTKYDLTIKLIKLVQTKFKIESKLFEDVKNINKDSLNTAKSDKLLNKCYKEIIQIKEDNQKNKELKSFRELIDKYEDNELNIISLRTYSNKYILIFNNMIKKFPYNIISKFKKYKIKTLIEGKELDTNFNNDLEV